MSYLITEQMIRDGLKAAYQTNSLSKQVIGKSAGCYYVEGYSGCAIGSWLPLWVLNQINNDGMNNLYVGKLLEAGIIQFDTPKASQLAHNLQRIYDKADTLDEFIKWAKNYGVNLL